MYNHHEKQMVQNGAYARDHYRRRAERLHALLAEAVTDDAIQSDEASHPTCRWCGETWGNRVVRTGARTFHESFTPEYHSDDCWVLRARDALAQEEMQP